VRAMPSGLCLYVAVRAELARVLDAEATRGEERCTSAPCLCGYTRAKAARRQPKRACRPWCQEGDDEHGLALSAMRLGSTRRTTQRRTERAELSGAR
jgi:hypothetical protein